MEVILHRAVHERLELEQTALRQNESERDHFKLLRKESEGNLRALETDSAYEIEENRLNSLEALRNDRLANAQNQLHLQNTQQLKIVARQPYPIAI